MPNDEAPFARPIKTIRTFEPAIDHILEGIERRGLRAGDRLPNESELSEQLRISKPTLRQALRVLGEAGVLNVRRGKGGGIFVSSEIVPVDLPRSVALEADAVVDALRARRVLDCGAVLAAMTTATGDDYEAIGRTNQLLEEHLGDRDMVMSIDAMFHRAVWRAAHNTTIERAMVPVERSMAPVRDAYSGGRGNDEKTFEIHVRQTEAMKRKDTTALIAVLHEHFLMLEENVARAFGKAWEDLFSAVAAPMTSRMELAYGRGPSRTA